MQVLASRRRGFVTLALAGWPAWPTAAWSCAAGADASHGCMRIHIPDVEELFEEVSLGMKVVIRPRRP